MIDVDLHARDFDPAAASSGFAARRARRFRPADIAPVGGWGVVGDVGRRSRAGPWGKIQSSSPSNQSGFFRSSEGCFIDGVSHRAALTSRHLANAVKAGGSMQPPVFARIYSASAPVILRPNYRFESRRAPARRSEICSQGESDEFER